MGETAVTDTETEGAAGPTRIAIACQGGGSHTAFTAGVLRELLENWDERHELVGISGTSGGAFNALTMWYGLVTEGPGRASELLGSLWDDLAVDGVQDRWLNTWVKTIVQIERTGLPVPAVSPYQLLGDEIARRRIREVLEAHVDFDAISELGEQRVPKLVIGTVDVNAGVFETFTDEAITVDAVLASAAVPSLFEAVEIDGDLYWDGLFSENPPIDDLIYVPSERKPDELWVIQVNAQTVEGEPSTIEVIADRRTELSANISLNQDLQFIEQVNEWIDDGKLPADEFTRTDIHRIQTGERYYSSTKVDRDPEFLAELRQLGRTRAQEFLEDRSS